MVLIMRKPLLLWQRCLPLELSFALLAAKGCKVFQLDVKSVFLNGDLGVKIFMNQPERFIMEGKESFMCTLKNSLYGFKQATRAWYKKILEYFTDIGLSKCVSDFDLRVLN